MRQNENADNRLNVDALSHFEARVDYLCVFFMRVIVVCGLFVVPHAVVIVGCDGMLFFFHFQQQSLFDWA